jgi:hypothetical protein
VTDRGQPAEEPLSGGNVSQGVVRVGDTVRRPAGPHTPAVHALLSHLHAVGFAGAWAFVDWDCAAPGTRLWDVAYALHGFVPLSADPRWRRSDASVRVRVFADAYGLDESQRRDLVPMLARRALSMRDFLARQASMRVQPWLGLWEAGHAMAWQADADYIQARAAVWAAALG